ncbi:MAG: acyl carrier protein [Oscillospiraceae bacterium]|jgi:acyl carrier protein|nr:acyl carrier protein [Oscillospiraceae bacterium]
METTKKLAMIEEIMDLDEGTLTPATVLEDLEEWDSMAKLSVMVMMDDEFGKVLTGDAVRALKTVQDILNFMDA